MKGHIPVGVSKLDMWLQLQAKLEPELRLNDSRLVPPIHYMDRLLERAISISTQINGP